MVSSFRAPPAAMTHPEPNNQDPVSDLDDYEPKDNNVSQLDADFQPPLSDMDVLIAEGLVPAQNCNRNAQLLSLRPWLHQHLPSKIIPPSALQRPNWPASPRAVRSTPSPSTNRMGLTIWTTFSLYPPSHSTHFKTHPPALTKNYWMEQSPPLGAQPSPSASEAMRPPPHPML